MCPWGELLSAGTSQFGIVGHLFVWLIGVQACWEKQQQHPDLITPAQLLDKQVPRIKHRVDCVLTWSYVRKYLTQTNSKSTHFPGRFGGHHTWKHSPLNLNGATWDDHPHILPFRGTSWHVSTLQRHVALEHAVYVAKSTEVAHWSSGPPPHSGRLIRPLAWGPDGDTRGLDSGGRWHQMDEAPSMKAKHITKSTPVCQQWRGRGWGTDISRLPSNTGNDYWFSLWWKMGHGYGEFIGAGGNESCTVSRH